jgi:hypothetical protein
LLLEGAFWAMTTPVRSSLSITTRSCCKPWADRLRLLLSTQVTERQPQAALPPLQLTVPVELERSDV